MKRLFGRKEKARPQRSVEPEEAKQASSLPTRPEAALESVHANETASNGLLSIDGASTSRSKSSFFSAVARGSSRTTMSTSGSDAGSTPVTTGSISGSSDGSSSAVSTRNDEPAGPRTAETATVTTRRTAETSSSAPAAEEKGWPAWMSRSIGKGRAKKEQLQQQQPKPTASSFSNLSRSGTYGLGAALQAIQKGGENKNSSKTTTTSANGGRPSNRESSEVSEASEDSSWDELGDDDDEENDRNSKNRKNSRVPASGRQRRPTRLQTGQPHPRSVFGGNAVGTLRSRETSKALANLHALTIDSLVPPTTAPPLVQSSSSIPFPKSSNRIRIHDAVSCTSFAQHSTLHMDIVRKRLLRRIERRVLTDAEQASILPLAARTPRTKDADKRRLPAAEETYEDSKAVGGGWSKGMKRWAMRPCFEERMVVWRAAPAGIIVTPVERDSRWGVAALEFSEGAEALAGLHRQNELPPPPSDIYVPASSRKLPPPLVIPRSSNGMNRREVRTFGANSTRGRVNASSKLRPSTVDPTAADEDDLPLGVVMLNRRTKEGGEERKRRVAAEMVERERRARDEEERNRKYAEQVAAARARREAEKAGKPGSKKDAWLSGEADALPPPIKPFASHHLKSSSNPNLAASNSSPLLSTIPLKPSVPRRQTTVPSSSASSFVTSTTATATPRPPETPRQHSAPLMPSPWTGVPMAGALPMSQSDLSGLSGSLPNMPMSAPTSQLHYPASMMMLPPHPDPISMAMFEQGLLRPWAMDTRAGGSAGTLTPPRPLFGFASSGDSSGSLTPPRFPNSRPSSWGSSSEDVRNALQRNSGTAGSRSGLSNAVDSQEWRNSRSSTYTNSEDPKRRKSHSKSPVEPPSSPWAEHNPKNLPTSVSSPLRPGHHHGQPSASSNFSSRTRTGGGGASIPSKTSIPQVPSLAPSTHKNPYGLSTNPAPMNYPPAIPRKSSTQTTLKEAPTTQRKSRLFS